MSLGRDATPKGVFADERQTARPCHGSVSAGAAARPYVVRIEPGHDAWVDGDEACVLLDTGVAGYARPTD